MIETNSTYPFDRGQFVCGGDDGCGELFYAPKASISFDAESDAYRAVCALCGRPAVETWYMRNLHKTIGSAKGANMSPEGRAKGRLNGFTTGSSATLPWYKGKIPMAPAKPGKYSECDGCQDLADCAAQVAARRGTCVPVYCHRKMEVTLKYAASFLSGDPEAMRLIAAQNSAQMQMVYNASIKKIFERGVELIEKEYKWGKDGDILCGSDGRPFEVEKIYAHPLIKRCIEIMQVMGFTLTDWTMTPKSKETREQVSGFLAGLAAGGTATIDDLRKEFSGEVEKFKGALRQAGELRQKDRALRDFESETGKREGDG